ncbi:MAG: Tad domain-containing protein [Pseudomonadota bacterium]
MSHQTHINRFASREDGSLLVFFAVSVLTILGIVALSFDLGRRASTQTDMQSFVDNVVLAAAGELDGTENAIANATRAANTVIAATNDRLKSGTAGQDVTIALDQIVFYESLPDTDAPASFDAAQLSDPASASYKYGLPPSDLGGTPDPELANYVGVRLATVDVPWIFAGVFSASDLPDQAIGAVAIAGNTAWTCDVAPLLFCLPQGGAGNPLELVTGQAINLRTARQGRRWRAGEFGFVDVDADPTGACAGLPNEAGRQACLITARARVAACFQPRRSSTQTGQRPAQESAAFDMSFDIFDQSMIQFFNDLFYAPGPHSISGRVPGGSGGVCAPGEPSDDTMAFPLDDCHPSGCLGGRFGDGDWSNGRDTYVETNYSLAIAGSDDDDDDDGDDGDDGDGFEVDGSFFDFPEPNLTRYEFYLREIERAANGGIMSPPYIGEPYEAENDGEGEAVEDYTSWDDYWPNNPAPNPFNPIIPDAHGRVDNGLPQCNLNTLAPDPERRVLLAGGINCPSGGNAVVGFDEDVPIIDFYTLFQLAPTENVGGFPQRFDLNVEVISRIPVEDIGSYREVVQLFR